MPPCCPNTSSQRRKVEAAGSRHVTDGNTSDPLTTADGNCLVVVVLQWLSCACLFATPWTVVPQAPLSMGFSRQEDWRENAEPY